MVTCHSLDTVSWVTGRTSHLYKHLYHFPQERVEKGNWLTEVTWNTNAEKQVQLYSVFFFLLLYFLNVFDHELHLS